MKNVLVKHSGIDLFFNGLSKKNATKFCQTLNALDRTMNGHSLVWKLTYSGKLATITARYPDVEVDVKLLPFMLGQNRNWVETGLTALGQNPKLYTGSEFYVQVPDMNMFKNSFNEMSV